MQQKPVANNNNYDDGCGGGDDGDDKEKTANTELGLWPWPRRQQQQNSCGKNKFRHNLGPTVDLQAATNDLLHERDYLFFGQKADVHPVEIPTQSLRHRSGKGRLRGAESKGLTEINSKDHSLTTASNGLTVM
jgi:hypothetical protein